MAHQPLSRPDPVQNPEVDEPLFALEHGPENSDVASVASKLAEHAGTADSAELALDLVLNEIVEQARLATTATGAAIALLRDEEMVCRASSGSSAPDLGVRLSTRSGLSGACLRSGHMQRCDDTQTDGRVNAAALAKLDVRSILIVPILNSEKMAGIFEIFSPRPSAFGDREVLTLEALSRRIVRNLETVLAPPEAPAVPAAVTPLELVAIENDVEVPVPVVLPEVFQIKPPARDYWTTVLTAVVIGLALLLGWMVGYAGWRKATASKVGVAQPVADSRAPSNDGAAPPSPPVKAAAKKSDKNSTTTVAPGGLVVYENGKVIFEMPPGETAASRVKLAGGSSGSAPVRLAPEVAETYLLRRVEAVYPAEAQSSQAVGPVTLEIRVDETGAVVQATVVSGDSSLASAAITAVRQWKYQPYAPEGAAMKFSTRATVNFSAK